MIIREKVLKTRMFVHKLNAHEWINENYPNAIESKVTTTGEYYEAQVWIMEDLEYNNLLIPISEVELLIESYRRKTYQNETTTTVVSVLETILKISKKIK